MDKNISNKFLERLADRQTAPAGKDNRKHSTSIDDDARKFVARFGKLVKIDTATATGEKGEAKHGKYSVSYSKMKAPGAQPTFDIEIKFKDQRVYHRLGDRAPSFGFGDWAKAFREKLTPSKTVRTVSKLNKFMNKLPAIQTMPGI